MTGYRPFLVVLMPSRADGIMDWDGVGVLEGWRDFDSGDWLLEDIIVSTQ